MQVSISHNPIAHPTTAVPHPALQILTPSVIGQPFPIPCPSESYLKIGNKPNEITYQDKLVGLGKE